MALEKSGNLWKREASSEQEKEHEKSTKRFAKKMRNDPEKIRENALFEKYLREELKTRKIQMDEKDISQIVGLKTIKKYPNTADLKTIKSRIRTQTGGDDRLIIQKPTPGGGSQMLSGELRDVFLERYPVDELAGAIYAAQNRAHPDMAHDEGRIQKEQSRIDTLDGIKEKKSGAREEAHKIIDGF